MSNEPRTLRVFISSPGDVAEERQKAKNVLDQLQRFYGQRVNLVPVLWEDLPLGADSSFQEGIDLILSEKFRIDIAVFIMWSRLGSPLGAAITKRDGSPYLSGTEREFDLMLMAREQSGNQYPHLLAYVRDDETGFRTSLHDLSTEMLPKAIEQQRLAENFIREQFHDDQGRNLRAYHTFNDPVSFARHLRVHLQAMVDGLLHEDSGGSVIWPDRSPYRGLEVFELEHAPVYFGREEEICDLELMLRRRWEEAGCASAIVVGSSGSGKSSLVRAGLAHSLIKQNLDPDVREWRHALILPREAAEDWGERLAKVLTKSGALPEMAEGGASAKAIGEAMRANFDTAWSLTLLPAFQKAAEKADGRVQLLLIFDQLEELFTDQRFSAEARVAFLDALVFLAKTGYVWVVGTLRSDFYAFAQAEPAFLKLKGGESSSTTSGQSDLLPPGPAAIQTLIERPATLAGLHFEKDEKSGRCLDEMIADDAIQSGSSLPLLEYTLDELYQNRDVENRVLTLQYYRELGGVKGALVTRAEREISELPPAVQKEFGAIMAKLVTLGVSGTNERPARRQARYEFVANSETRKQFIDRFIAARLFTADRDEHGNSVVTLAHEALLWEWDRLKSFISERQEFLRFRAQLEEAAIRWGESGKKRELLSRDRGMAKKALSLIHTGEISAKSVLGEFLAATQRIIVHERRWRMMIWFLLTGCLVFLFWVDDLMATMAADGLNFETINYSLLFMGPVAWATMNAWMPSHRGKRLTRYFWFYVVFSAVMVTTAILYEIKYNPAASAFAQIRSIITGSFVSLATPIIPVLIFRKILKYPADFRRLRLPSFRPWWRQLAISTAICVLAAVPFFPSIGVNAIRQAMLRMDVDSLAEFARGQRNTGNVDLANHLFSMMEEKQLSTIEEFRTVANYAFEIENYEKARKYSRLGREQGVRDLNRLEAQPGTEDAQRAKALATLIHWLAESNATYILGERDEFARNLDDALGFARSRPNFRRTVWLPQFKQFLDGLAAEIGQRGHGSNEVLKVQEKQIAIWKLSIPDLLEIPVVSLSPEDSQLVQQYGYSLQGLAQGRIIAGDYEGALSALHESDGFLPGQFWTYSLEAEALLLNGREEEAMEIYRRHIGKTVSVNQGGVQTARGWEEFVQNDFAALRANQIFHPKMGDILAELSMRSQKDRSFNTWLIGGQQAFNTQNLPLANDFLRRMQNAGPENSFQYRTIGDLAATLSDFPLALEHYRAGKVIAEEELKKWEAEENSERRQTSASEEILTFTLSEFEIQVAAGQIDEGLATLERIPEVAAGLPKLTRESWLPILNIRTGNAANRIIWQGQDWKNAEAIAIETTKIWRSQIADLLENPDPTVPNLLDDTPVKLPRNPLLQQFGFVLQNQCFRQLNVRNYKAAIQSAAESQEWAPGFIWTYSLHAAALLLDGQEEEAWMIYREHVGESVPDPAMGQKRWREFVRVDFQTLRGNRINHPKMNEIQKYLDDRS